MISESHTIAVLKAKIVDVLLSIMSGLHLPQPAIVQDLI